jgi:hypothetical protein
MSRARLSRAALELADAFTRFAEVLDSAGLLEDPEPKSASAPKPVPEPAPAPVPIPYVVRPPRTSRKIDAAVRAIERGLARGPVRASDMLRAAGGDVSLAAAAARELVARGRARVVRRVWEPT